MPQTSSRVRPSVVRNGRRWCAIVAVASLAGCNSGTDSPVPTIATQVSPTSISVGGAMQVTTTVINDTPVHVTVDANTCDAPFEVIDAFDRIVGPGFDAACPAGPELAVVGSGQTLELTGVWTGLAKTSTPENPVYVPPGTYRIRGSVRSRELNARLHGVAIVVQVTQ